MPRVPKEKLSTLNPLSIPASAQEDYPNLYVKRAVFIQKPDGNGVLRAYVIPCRDDGNGGVECAPDDQVRPVVINNITATAKANENTNEAIFIEALEDLVEGIENTPPAP
jgi:hypothetical protein